MSKIVLVLSFGFSACGGNGQIGGGPHVPAGDEQLPGGDSTNVGGDSNTDGDVLTRGDIATAGDTNTAGDQNTTPPPTTCVPTISLYDTTSPTATIGTGTPASCDEGSFRTAAQQGGTITFNCGPNPTTIAINETVVLPLDRDTIIDGGGLITLDAQGQTRHFIWDHPDWMNNQNKLVLQRLVFRNGAAPTGQYFPQDPGNPTCAYGYKEGSGGVVYMRNGVLHVIDCEFYDNQAALVGPDVGGGALYVLGVPELVVVGSRFVGNRGSNAGAIGLLFAGTPHIYNSYFENNTSEGVGANYVEPGCPNFNHNEQGGAGGNGGAVTFDGLNDAGPVYTICGSTFINNRANELGGALFRTPNAGQRQMRIEKSLFDGNTGRLGGVSFIKQNDVTVRDCTFANNRSGVDITGQNIGGPLGGLWTIDGNLDLENSTFYNNQPTGLDVQNGNGSVTNATFVDSRIAGNIDINNSLFVNLSCNASFTGANNLQWPNDEPCVQAVQFADPGIGTLGDNGGPTPTILPDASGPVMGVGQNCPATDQRGQPRNTNTCAAGAVEP